MTRNRQPARWYVTARYMHLTAYLCGPFRTAREAMAMIEPVRRAMVRSDDPRHHSGNYGATKRAGRKLAPGSMRLDWLALSDVIEASAGRV